MKTRNSVRIFAAGVLAAASLPAFAHHDTWHDRGRHPESRPLVVERYGHGDHRPGHVDRRVVVERPVYVDRPVYVQPYGGNLPYYPADANGMYEYKVPVYGPVYGPQSHAPVYPVYGPHSQVPVYGPVYEPQPQVIVQHRQPNVVGVAAGAAIGAVIGSQVGHGHSRVATSAIGAAIGGVLGSQF